jgi:hypothetical protein
MNKIRNFMFTSIILLISAACAAPQTSQVVETTASSPTSPTSSPSPNTENPLPTTTSPVTPTASTSAAHRLLWVSSSSDLFNRVVSVDPKNQQRIAYCAPDEIRLSLDAGQTWESPISTVGVAAAAEQNGYTLFSGDSPSSATCLSVTFDPEFSSTLYAIFSAAQMQYGAPPVFYMGFFTIDNGNTWEFVPPPPSLTLEDFGGFWNLGGYSVEAMFHTINQSDDQIPNVVLQETDDGGQTWQPGELSCPKSGPCLRWGPAASNIPGMGSPLPQEILISLDGGQSWSTIDPPVELRLPAPNQLVAISDHEVAIIAGSISHSAAGTETPPVRYSEDSGRTWQEFDLPAPASASSEITYYPGLQILPNDTYLTQAPENSTWLWMSPTLQDWCPVNTDSLPLIPQLLQSVGDQLWWVNAESNQAEHISLSEITCAEN